MSTAVLIITLQRQYQPNITLFFKQQHCKIIYTSSAYFTLCCLQPPANTLGFRVPAQTDALLDLDTCLEV